jgi:ABC-type lipoprotein release transport system permease subunit
MHISGQQIGGLVGAGIGTAIAVVVVLQLNGLIPDATAETFYKLLGAGGLIAIKHAITKATV